MQAQTSGVVEISVAGGPTAPASHGFPVTESAATGGEELCSSRPRRPRMLSRVSTFCIVITVVLTEGLL